MSTKRFGARYGATVRKRVDLAGLEEAFKVLAYELERLYEATKSGTPESVRGVIREYLASRFFKACLPSWCSLGRGEIVSSTGDSSGELDITIYDRDFYRVFRPFTLWLNRYVYPACLLYTSPSPRDRG